MQLRFSYHPYRRPFVHPLHTAQGLWSLREGFIVRVEQASQVAYGEIAPIPGFGTETMQQAQAFLQRLIVTPELAQDRKALAALPCCAFGVSAAVAGLNWVLPRRSYQLAGLLPAGSAAQSVLAAKLAQGYSWFKWKIGVAPPALECVYLKDLCALLPEGVRLRLDANAGLSSAELEQWLRVLQTCSEQIDYLEQPLPVGQEAQMAAAAASFGIPIALDESLSAQDGRRWLEPGNWPGPLVLKPALLGDCGQLIERLRPVASQVVLSSAFETLIGLENALRVADQLPGLNPGIGFDTMHAFKDMLLASHLDARLTAELRARFNPEHIWQQLPHLN